MDFAGPSSSCIPEEELTYLLLTLTDAFQLSAAGEPRRGYLKVLGGLVRVGRLTYEHQPWVRDLRAHWTRALQEYVDRHPGIDLEDQLRIAEPREERVGAAP